MSIEKQTIFKGVCTALITPFYKGKIDYESLQNLIEMQIEAGVGAILVAGTTGESPTLSVE
jgi:4-hydroxy-tetrahydrodipicolinate synthase